jgi:hypothetical protein
MQRSLQKALKIYSPEGKRSPVGRYKPGIRLVCEWGGVIHEAQVTDVDVCIGEWVLKNSIFIRTA